MVICISTYPLGALKRNTKYVINNYKKKLVLDRLKTIKKVFAPKEYGVLDHFQTVLLFGPVSNDAIPSYGKWEEGIIICNILFFAVYRKENFHRQFNKISHDESYVTKKEKN